MWLRGYVSHSFDLLAVVYGLFTLIIEWSARRITFATCWTACEEGAKC